MRTSWGEIDYAGQTDVRQTLGDSVKPQKLKAERMCTNNHNTPGRTSITLQKIVVLGMRNQCKLEVVDKMG